MFAAFLEIGFAPLGLGGGKYAVAKFYCHPDRSRQITRETPRPPITAPFVKAMRSETSYYLAAVSEFIN